MRLDILKDKSALLRHSLSLLISLIIHATLICFLAVYFVSVKIIDFKNQITPVILVAPEELHLPRIEGNLPNPQDWTAQFPELASRRTRPLSRPEAPLAEHGAAESRQESLPVNSEWSSVFRLDQTRPEKGESVFDKGQRFTLPMSQKPSPGSTALRTSPPTSVDFRQYMYGIPAGRGPTSGVYYGGTRGGAYLRGRTAVSPAVKSYDLSSWARGVIELIQKNWTIPPSQVIRSEDTVEIAVVILRDGEISSATIVNASDNKSFDQAALEAVEVSSPLPPLPHDFPEASVDITFVFSKQW